jgi:hypothetical protein
MMTVAPGRIPTLASAGRRSDPLDKWIEKEMESASENGVDVPDGAQQSRGRSRPALERAYNAIERLYPTGVPEQAAEPNTILCRRVGETLKNGGLPGVSDDTILRAAGRRR